MNMQYALYDALVSINVPADKARAVVESMEQDMITVLATKADLNAMQLLLKQEIGGVRDSLKQEIGSVRQEMGSLRDSLKQEIGSVRQEMGSLRDSLKQEIGSVRQEMGSLRDSLKQEIGANQVILERQLATGLATSQQQFTAGFAELRLELKQLDSSMTIKLGSMMIVGLSLIFAALKLV